MWYIANSIPIFSENITQLNVTYGETFNLTLSATDEDKDVLTLEVEGLPDGASHYLIGDNMFLFTWNVQSRNQVILYGQSHVPLTL